MNINNLFPSKYVKAMDLGDKPVTVTIKEMTVEKLGHGNEQEQKPVLWFTNATKGLVLNRTNAMIIASLYSPETDNWKGKQISLYAARVKAFGSWHDAVRVKEQIPARNVRQQPVPDALQEPPPIDDEEDLLDADEGQRRVDPDTGEIITDVDFGMGAQTPQHAQNGTAPVYPPKYAVLIDRLEGDCLERANRARKIHAQSKGPASLEQYRYLAGVIDAIVKAEKAHNAVLEVFVGRTVNSDNPPGMQLAGKLLDALVEERTVERDGEKVKEANPDYNPDAVNCVRVVHRLIIEHDGQASLFEAEATA